MKKPTPFGKYFLLERINVGGMAEVFRSKAFGVEGFERLVAVKRILPNIAEDKEFIRMFIEEAKLSVQLNHANIAQIFDLGVVDGAYYIALEHVHGRDLRGIFDRCRQVGETMPVAQACFIVMKVCEGLDYAHNKRDQSGRELSLVHRDVSPQNVLVSFEGEVKIIDFGIAKAAGKGSKTQAGILKGKFGYMSPEQVRGLPVDRRSDVFSCGIVLYELLTGERLFVGESDFSTLEKVRNVEILPPSTYNRKIPDELERIVLKALAKDVEDRYQNAIDLHDELQAFVYTAGEFYSRKDLAGWMKKTFGKEIEEESAKLESYRQLKPPAPVEASGSSPAISRTSTKPPATPPVRRTSALPAVGGGASAPGTKPPPPPRVSQQMPVVSSAPAPAPMMAPARARSEDSGDLAWDDDELETQIYDNPEDDPKNKIGAPRTGKALPLSPGAGLAAADERASSEPDLSSLVSTAKGWEKGPAVTPASQSLVPVDEIQPGPAATMTGLGVNGQNGAGKLATGSNKVASPAPQFLANASQQVPAVQASESVGGPVLFSPREIAAPNRLVSPAVEAPFDPMGTFGSSIAKRDNKRGIMLFAIGGAVLAAIAVVVVIAMSKKDKAPTQPPPVATEPVAAPGSGAGSQVAVAAPPVQTPPPGADQNTGFDLYVNPAGVTQWKLDGEARTDRLPSRIRGIAPGAHTVQIDPPAGFMSQNQQINVEAGKAPKVEIVLSPIQGITGMFESTPPGATVSLIIDGKRTTVGPSPAKAPLDPRYTYQVLFEKPGYVSVNKPVSFTGALEEKVAVNLEKTGGTVAAANPPPTGPVTSPRHDPAPRHNDHPEHNTTPPPDHGSGLPDDSKVGTDTPKTPPKPAGQGTLVLGSKPPCDIFIDGSDSGLHTPQKDIKLSAGKHRITLMNNEFGIKETFSVEITADKAEKVIKDFSDKLPK